MPSKPQPESITLHKDRALDLLRQMWEIRLFEERVYDLLGKNQIKGASHLYAGEEAVAVGAVSTLRDDDWITSAHRVPWRSTRPKGFVPHPASTSASLPTRRAA